MACPCLVVPGDEHAGRVLFSCAPQPRVGSPLPSRVHRVVRSHSGFRFSRRSLASVTFSPSPQICRTVACVQNMIRRTLPLHLRCYCTMPDIMPSPAAEVVKSADSGKEKTSRGQECPVLLESLVPEIRVPVLFYIAVGLKRFAKRLVRIASRYFEPGRFSPLLHACPPHPTLCCHAFPRLGTNAHVLRLPFGL